MEKRIVLQEDNRYIYWIKGEDSVFYLSIPKATQVNLVLNLIPNVTDDVMKNLKHDGDKVMVVPIVDGDVLDRVKVNNATDFQTLDGIFSSTINMAYQILSYNHLQVNEVVSFLENSSFESFQTWFIQKYQGRVILIKEKKELDSVPPVQEVSSVIEENNSLKNQEVVANTNKSGSMGFVSYVLLGVVVAVLSLVMLYFLI